MPSASATESSSVSPLPGMTSPDDERQDFADGVMDSWLASQGANSLAAFTEPFSFMSRWASPERGKLAVTVDSKVEDFAVQKGGEVTDDLRLIGANLLVVANTRSLQATQVRVATDDGKHSTVVRYDDPLVIAD